MSKVIIIGSGCSRGTLGKKAPVSSEFGKYLNCPKKQWKWTEDYPYLEAAVKYFEHRVSDTSPKSWFLDKIWGAIDTRVKLQHVFNCDLKLPSAPQEPPKRKKIYEHNEHLWCKHGDDFGPAGFELRCAVTRVFGEDLEDDIGNITGKQCSLQEELNALKKDDSVISFNYDLLVEKMLCSIGKQPFTPTPWSKEVTKDNEILLTKPHGSVSWKAYTPEREKRPEMDKLVYEKDIDYYPKSCTEIFPGIIAPVPFKEQLLIPDIQRPVWNFHCLLIKQWSRLITELSKAEEVVIMGYAFPIEDLHALHIFAEAAAQNKSQTLKIRVYEKDCDRYSRISRNLCKLFKQNNLCIKYMGPVKPPD